jgi:PAS domain S-box-containing protein
MRPGSDRTWVPYFVLVISVLITVLSSYYVASMARNKDLLRFTAQVDRQSTAISSRLETYISLLRSAAAAIAAYGDISREEFHRYVTRLRLSESYPGIQGIGLSLRVPPGSLDSLVEAMHQQGIEDFHVWPDSARDEYHTVIYLEPGDRRNRQAIGFDMHSETVRRAAMDKARDTGWAVMSGKVTLVQEIDNSKQPGFLIYVPMYAGGGVPATVEERRKRLIGYIYSPFRSEDLLKNILAGIDQSPTLDFKVFDGRRIVPENLLYTSASDSLLQFSGDKLVKAKGLEITGRTWVLLFIARPEFEEASSQGLVKYIAGGGMIISLVLFAISLAQSRARRRAERIAGELRQSEDRLRESESRLRRLVESDILGIIIADMAGNVIEANDAFLDIVDYSREDLRAGRINWADLTPPEYWQADEDAIRRMRRTGSHPPFEKEFVRSDGRRIPVLVGTAYLGGPEDLGVGFLLDLSGQKRIEEALRHSEIRFRTMIEQSPLAIQIFSLDGECVLANNAWENLWHTPRSVLATYNILQDRQLEERGVMSYIREGFAGESVAIPPFRYEMQLKDMSTRARWIRVFIYPLRDDDGDIAEIAAKIEDVTDRIEAEEQLKQAKESAESANRAKDQFLAVLSHELRTPLSPVLTAIHLLDEDSRVSDDQHEMLELIRRNVELEARLIDDLLDLTRISNGKLRLNIETVDAHALIANVLEIVEAETEGKGVQLTLDLAAVDHFVPADSARLQQVLWNLLKNAMKFTPAGGCITVRTLNSDRLLRVEVADTGIGIDPAVLPRIFNAFEQGEQSITRKFGGMGLGLAISKMLMELHGGSLTASSEGVGKGATFTVEIRTIAEDSTGGAAGAGVKADIVSSGHASILLVEDHVDTGTIMKQLLERHGYSVTAADSVAAALRLASATTFDLLISDIGLPDGTGLELIEKLGDRRPAKAIALSGYGMDEDVRRSMAAGFAEHLTKPVNFRRLHEVIQNLLESQNGVYKASRRDS